MINQHRNLLRIVWANFYPVGVRFGHLVSFINEKRLVHCHLLSGGHRRVKALIYCVSPNDVTALFSGLFGGLHAPIRLAGDAPRSIPATACHVSKTDAPCQPDARRQHHETGTRAIPWRPGPCIVRRYALTSLRTVGPHWQRPRDCRHFPSIARPLCYGPDNRLTARIQLNMLNGHLLLADGAVGLQGLHLHGIWSEAKFQSLFIVGKFSNSCAKK